MSVAPTQLLAPCIQKDLPLDDNAAKDAPDSITTDSWNKACTCVDYRDLLCNLEI